MEQGIWIVFTVRKKITTDSETEDVTETVSDVVEEYAKKIQQAMKEKDINKLADLVTYPVYIGLGDGQIIESRADFIKLDSAENTNA